MSKLTKLFVENILTRIDYHGGVADLARKTGLARATIDKWLRDEQSPNLENVEIIAKALGVGAWELLKPEESEPTQTKPSIKTALKIVNEALGFQLKPDLSKKKGKN